MRILRALAGLLVAAVCWGQETLPAEKLFPSWPKVWTSFDLHPKDCHLGVVDARGRLVTVGVETKGNLRTVEARQQITMVINERGFWTDPIEISRPGVVYFPALAVAADGRVWVAWSEFDGESWRILARSWMEGELSPAVRISRGDVNLQPSLAVDGERVAAAWQSAVDGRFEIQGSAFVNGQWLEPHVASRGGEQEFRPKLAADSGGNLWVVWDRFERGRYRTFAKYWSNGEMSPERAVFSGDTDTLYPQIAADQAGKVWILASGRVAALDAAGNRFELEAELPAWRDGPDFLSTDPEGRVWLFKGLGSRNSFDWLPAYRNAQTAVAVADSAGLRELPVQNTYLGYGAPQVDGAGRVWAMNRVQFLRFEPLAEGLSGAPQVKSAPLTAGDPEPVEKRAWPRFEVEVDGRKQNIYWAEMHNHLRELALDTQIASWVDRFYLASQFRFGLDAAAITDHDWPRMNRSMYFAEQGISKILNRDGTFLAFAGFEWSGDSQIRGRYGDRTVLFPDGYVDIPRISDESSNTAEKLSRQVARIGGLDWPHHIGRQESPVPPESLNEATEPVMEMTSGHGVFETYDPERAVPVPFKTQLVKGTSVQDALRYGKRVGMVGSSDSHRGFPNPRVGMLAVAAPELTREAVLKAILARRTYAIRGGEPILVDFRVNGHYMGSEFTASGPVEVEVKVTGSKAIRRIDLIRNGEYILMKRFDNGSAEQQLSYRDLETAPAYYYARVWQGPGEWAWTTPVWVDREPAP